MPSNSKTIISDILKILMFKKNVKATELAKEIKVQQQTLQRIVSGVSPNPHSSTLKPIADYFDVSIDQLTGTEQLPESYLPFPSVRFKGDLQRKVREVPLLTWEQIDNFFNHDNKGNDNKIIVTVDFNEKCFGLTMGDSSMDPYFSQGTLLIIDPEKPFKDRSFVLVKLHDEALYLFRQILIDGQHKYLKPLNPDLKAFKMKLLDEKDHIFGVLVEARKVYGSTTLQPLRENL